MIEGKSTKKVLFKSGRIIDPFTKTFNGDILVENGKFQRLAIQFHQKEKIIKL